MKKLFKPFLFVVITVMLVLSVFTVAASASHMDFGGGTSEKKISDYPKSSWDNPIGNGKVRNGSKLYDAFGDFRYVQNSSSSGGAVFKMNGDRIVGVYTPKNDYDNYDVYFAATFDSELKKRVELGQVEVKIVAQTQNANGTFNQETGRISLKGYQSNKSTETFNYYSPESKCDGGRTVESGWIKIPSNTKYLRINAWSKRTGLGTQSKNRSAVYDIKVYFRDVTPPKPVEAGIVEDDYNWNRLSTQTNSAGDTFRVARPGDKITYYVKFNEAIHLDKSQTGNLKLRIQHRGKDPKKTFEADYTRYTDDTVYFTYTVTDNSDCVVGSSDTSLNPTGKASEIVSKGYVIADSGYNYIDYKKNVSVSNLFKISEMRIDDIKTKFANQQSDENGYFPAKYTKVPTGGYVYGEGKFPEGLIGTTVKSGSGNPNLQPTLASPETPLYFRIVVDEEIQKASLNENTKLKLVLSKNLSTPFTHMKDDDAFGYATLVAARVVGNNKGSGNHYGIKNNVYTEMFFEYVHDKNNKYTASSIYTVYPAFDAKSHTPSTSMWNEVTTLENDGYFLSNNGSPLYTTSGMAITGLSADSLKSGTIPKVDACPPVLKEKNVSSTWNTALPDYTRLVFEDENALSNNGVTISVVGYDKNGNKSTLPILMPGSSVGYAYTIPTLYSAVSLGGLKVADTFEGELPEMYIEYSVSDMAGNTTNNYGKKDIRIYLDNSPPETSYKDGSYTVDGNSATVSFNVKDYGVGEIAPLVFYKVEAMGMFGNTPKTTLSSAYKYTNPNIIDFTGVQGTRELWRVWASYADTLGNRATDDKGNTVYTPSESIELATRKLNMYATLESEVVSDAHEIKIHISDEPTTDYKIDFYYKWVIGSKDNDNTRYKKITFTDFEKEIASINFADEKIIQQFVPGSVFGEYTFFAYATLYPENISCYNINKTVYFDKSAPTITAAVRLSGTSQASEIHYIDYNITDNAASYKNGIYVKNRNIKFVPEYKYSASELAYPKLNVYIDNALVKTVDLKLLTGTYTSNVKEEFLSNKEFAGSRSISYEIVAEDNFGHKTIKKLGNYYIDAIAPELSDIEVKFKDGAEVIDKGDYYIISSFADIESISAKLTDNFSGKLTVSHRKNGNFSHFTSATESDTFEYTYKNPVSSDFTMEQLTSDSRGPWVYVFSMHGSDVIGNEAYKEVSFLIDRSAPEIKGRIPTDNLKRTVGDKIDFILEYTYENHERFEDFTVEAEGEGVSIAHTMVGAFHVFVTRNTEVTLTVTDAMGKSTEKTFEVNWYDETSPEIGKATATQTPASGTAKYGEIKVSATDESYVMSMEIAIVEEGKEPEDTDFFNGYAYYKMIEGEPDEDGNPTYVNSDELYFGDETTDYTEARFYGNAGVYTLEYKAIPDGTYDVYARATDSHGNTCDYELLTQITTTSEGAQLISGPTYTPDTLTGGEVVVNVKTDIPTIRIYDIEGDGSIAAMQEAVTEARARGFSYVLDYSYNNHTDFDDINALFEELRDKDEYELTPEEKEIYKGHKAYSSGASFDPYTGILDPENNYDYVTPQKDILDFLHNEAFYPVEDEYDGYYDFTRTVTEGTRLVNIVDSFTLDTEALADAGIINDDETGFEADEVGIYTMNVLTYPSRFDESAYDEYSKAAYEKYLVLVNPFYGEILTEEFIYENFGENIDLSLFTEGEAEGEYFFPIGEDITAEQLNEKGFGDYLELFSTGEYMNPFTEDGENLTEEEIIAALDAIAQLKALRMRTATIVADKYCKLYLNTVNQTYTTNHNMRFKYNTDRTVRFLDKTGQEIAVPVKITWIDPSLPHVPYDNVTLEVVDVYESDDGEVYESTYPVNGAVALNPEPEYNIVEKKLRLTIDLTGYKENEEVEIYDQYYIVNPPNGSQGEEVYSDIYDELPLYDKITVDITENCVLEFDVINPYVIDDATKKYIAPQIYVVDCIDSEAPTATLEYSPEKPYGSNSAINTDVKVSAVNIIDNNSAGFEVQLDYDEMYEINDVDELPDELYYEETYTFTENGEFIFVVTDKVGNKTYLPASVDYIDKKAVDIDIKLYYEGEEVDIEDVSEDNDDFRFTNKTYVVNDDRAYGKALTIKAFIDGELIAEDVVLVGESSWSIEYEGPSGNIGTAYISGFEFDTQPPEASVSYELHSPGMGAKSYAVAEITIVDENIENLTVVSVSGHTDSHEFTLSDAVIANIDKENSVAKIDVVFEDNGYADVTVADAVGNTIIVQLSVSGLDRVAPTATIQYSKKTPTNKNVDAVITLSENADYQIYDINGDILRDYAGTYTTYFSYTFAENTSVFFRFMDDDGNESISYVAGVSNIDREMPKLRVKEIHKNKAIDMEGEMVTYYGAATIELEIESDGDILMGSENDTIVLVGASQSLRHTVMKNGAYTFNYSDLAGNMNKLTVEVNVIDDTLPTATVTGNPTEWTNVAPEITITANPKADGSPSYVIMNGVQYDNIKFTATENGKVSYVLKDDSNNSVTGYVDVRFVDTDAPIITFEGNKDIYVMPGEFDKAGFEALDYYDKSGGSGITDAGIVAAYPAGFDANTPGKYDVTFSVSDIAGNTTHLVRTLTVLGEDDVYAVINGTVLIPDTMTTFWNGEELELSFLNAETQGNKLSYAFEPGYFMAAEMKGSSYKNLTTPDSKIKLEASEPGMYTLFVQTEDRTMLVMYVFVAGTSAG